MKRILALLLAALMLMTAAVACKDNTETPDGTENNDPAQSETPDANEDDKTEDNGVIAPEVEAGTMGETMWNAFQDAVAANPAVSMEELANTLISNPVIQFMGGAMPIEAGTEYFAGFDEYKITGFESAAVYMPMMGSIAFVGYVFDLAEGADVNAFIKSLTDNCNPRWNICVSADQTVAGAIGDKVFFLMCPASMGDGSEEGGMMGPVGGADVYYPITLEEGTTGYGFWTAFEDIMIEGAITNAAEIANALCVAELVPISLGAMEVAPGLLTGFDNYEVTGFSSGAVFMPMIGSIPFVGYIFQAEAGTDMLNFVNDLSANCNPRWNVCVEADETLVGYYNDYVFFLMCPAQ